MIELRWYQYDGDKTTTRQPVLQYRQAMIQYTLCGVAGMEYREWSGWIDVPLVLAPTLDVVRVEQPSAPEV